LQNVIRKAYWTYINNIISDQDDPISDGSDLKKPTITKKFWTYIKGRGADQQGVQPLLRNGVLHQECKTKATILNYQFESVLTKEDMVNFPNKGDSLYSIMDDIIISVEGVQVLLKNMKPNKAIGQDEIGRAHV
jgi:hypothetical protein